MNQIIGRHVANRYILDEFLAKGGMGVVYRGHDLSTGQPVAVKHLIQTDATASAAVVERFVREGEALRVLAHPNIVAMLDAIQENGEYYLVMEYVSGGSLAELLVNQPQLPVERVAQLGLDIADALTRAHRLRIIHRDLKPANILLSLDGTPRLTDFGIARIDRTFQMTKPGTVLGTLAYLPPEALNGDVIDARGDVWAFGVMLFEMLAGHRPFQDEPLSALIGAILSARIPDLEVIRPDAPAALIDLIYRMLDKEKQTRIGSMRQVGTILEAILGDSHVVTVAPTRLMDIPMSKPTAVEHTTDHSPAPSVTPVTPAATGIASNARGPSNLPAQTTPFVGRDDERTTLNHLLSDPQIRMITIVGPGGMGKTRLSIELAAAQHGTAAGHRAERFPDGVFFVSLAPLVSTDLLIPAIAEAIRFQFYQGGTAREQLFDFFREKSLLLVLDNFEHLIESAALVADILQVAPGVKIIVTSRERLNIQAETLFRLEGMDFPDWETPDDALEYSAVQLFVQSARRALPSFSLTTDQLPYVARICRLVRGLPLGIVLAAAWVDSLSVAEIAEEIARSLDFLATEARDVPSRQRSLQSVFDYSWALLSADEQFIFAALSVFRGGFDREAAQAITNTSLRSLSNLVNKSLLRRAPDGRYEVHELLRQYAAVRLATDPTTELAIKDRHGLYYSTLVNRQVPRLTNREQIDAIATLETEMDNIGVAWEHGIQRENLESLNNAWEGLILYNLRFSQNESSLRLFQMTADSLSNVPPGVNRQADITRGTMLGACGYFKAYTGQRDQAIRDFDEGERLIVSAGNIRELGLIHCFRVLPKVLIEEPLGETNQQSLVRLQAALAIAQDLNDKWMIATVNSLLAWIYNNQGDYQTGLRLTEDSLAMMRDSGDEVGQISGLYGLGWTAVYRGDYDMARSYFAQTCVIHRKVNAWRALGYGLLSLSEVSLLTNDLVMARADINEATGYFKQIGDRRGVVIALSNLARVVEREGKPGEALQLFEDIVNKSRALENLALLAVSLNELARIEALLNHGMAARSHWQEALRLAITGELIRVVLDVLLGLAGLIMLDTNDRNPQRLANAVLLYGYVEAHPAVVAEVRHAAQNALGQLRGILPETLFNTALHDGQTGDLQTITAVSFAD